MKAFTLTERRATSEAALQKLRDRIEEIRAQRSRQRHSMPKLRGSVESAEVKIQHEKNVLQGASTIARSDTPEQRLRRERPLQDAEAELTAAQQVLADGEQELARLEAELSEHERQRDSLIKQLAIPAELDAKALAEHQRAIGAAAAEVERLKRLIADQQKRLTAVDDAELNSARQQRQTVLADIAEGRGDNKALTTVNGLLAKLKEKVTRQRDDHEAVADTIAGLRPRLATAEQKHRQLVEAAPVIAEQYVRSELAKLVGQLEETVAPAIRLHHKLNGLQSILAGLQGGVFSVHRFGATDPLTGRYFDDGNQIDSDSERYLNGVRDTLRSVGAKV